MNTYNKDKVNLIIMIIWLGGIHVAFELVYLQLIHFQYTSYLYPIKFFLYLTAINYPIMHRIMAVLEKYNSHNELFGLGKIILDLYFILLLVNVFYCNSILLGLKWFCLIFFMVYSINLICKMQKEVSVFQTDLDNGLTFQVTCIEYWALMVSNCSLGNNRLSIILSIFFLVATVILRVISLYDNQKTNRSIDYIIIKFVGATLGEWIAFALFFIGVPFDDLKQFFAELYIKKPTIYIDMLCLLIVCCLLEFPMNHIRNKLCK